MEAQLVNSFEPEYNTVKFVNYPKVKGGMRSKGYAWTDLEVESLPVSFRTASFCWEASVSIDDAS